MYVCVYVCIMYYVYVYVYIYMYMYCIYLLVWIINWFCFVFIFIGRCYLGYQKLFWRFRHGKKWAVLLLRIIQFCRMYKGTICTIQEPRLPPNPPSPIRKTNCWM
jgi:hypothetical protein